MEVEDILSPLGFGSTMQGLDKSATGQVHLRIEMR
jgi:hypothetical protein